MTYGDIIKIKDRILLAKGKQEVKSIMQVAYTDDDMKVWQNVSVGDIPGEYAFTPHVMVSINNIALMGTSESRIYRSEDLGKSWNLVEHVATSKPYVWLKVIGNRVYAASADILIYSDDTGLTWNYALKTEVIQ